MGIYSGAFLINIGINLTMIITHRAQQKHKLISEEITGKL